jgi:hypothetical protein
MTLEEFTKSNNDFWAEQKTAMERCIANPAVLATAVEAIKFDVRRQVPFGLQMRFEVALTTAEEAGARFQSQLARKGGCAPKADR